MRPLLGLLFGIAAVILAVMGLSMAIIAAAPYIALGLVAVGAAATLFSREEEPPTPPPRIDPPRVYDDPHWTRLLPPPSGRDQDW